MTKLPAGRMSMRSLQPDLSEEERRLYRVWTRRCCLVYSALLLVLLGVGAASDWIQRPTGGAETVEAKGTAAPAVRSAKAVKR